MGEWPSGPIPTTNVDQTSDPAGNARADIETAFTRINDMLTARESVDGVCGLDGSGFVPSARVGGFGLLKANNLSDLALASAARTNLGITVTGSSVVTSATAAAALAAIGGMPLAGGTFTGAPLYAADPSVANELTRRSYVLAQIAAVQPTLKFATVYDEKAISTNGGAGVGATWNTRDLNQENDPSSFVTLAANQFALAAGSYLFIGNAQAGSVGANVLRIQNITDASTAASGINATSSNHPMVHGFETIGANKTYELQHYLSSSGGVGDFGVFVSHGLVNIYAKVLIIQYA